MTWLVVGLGNPDRGDDAVGPVVAAGLTGLGLLGVDVITCQDPTCLLDVWTAYPGVVVVDAIHAGVAPGRVLTMEAGATAGVLADQAWVRTGRGGTHAFGLAAAIELGRALDRLPERLVLVGVEVQRVDHGGGLSPAVWSALGRVQDEVVDVVTRPAPLRRPAPAPAGEVAPAVEAAAAVEPEVAPEPPREPAAGARAEHRAADDHVPR